MGVYLTFKDSAKFLTGKKIDLLTRPVPTIQASGIGGAWLPQTEVWSDGGEMTAEQIEYFMKKKPPYRVPLMSEINRVPWNGLVVVSTFVGGGGSSTGYKMAGYRVAWANEFEVEAQRTYRANHPKTYLDPRDIKVVKASEILERIGMERGEVDIFDGSPPCQGFSLANKNRMSGKAKTYENGVEQVNEELFYAYTALLEGLQPKAFIAENVRGLTVGKAKEMLGDFQGEMFTDQSGTILHALMDCGYLVRYKVLNAADHGTPQSRPRVIFVGIRNDLATRFGLEPVFPEPLGYHYSVADACPWIRGGTVVSTANERHVANGRRPADDATEGPCPTITTQRGSVYIVNRPPPRKRVVPREAIFKDDGVVGKAWDKLEPGENDPKNFSITKAHPDKPSPTITACGAWQLHPFEKRRFTIEEVKRLGGFPDDYVLTGKFAQQWARVGNSVPPPMMYHISSALRRGFFNKIKGKP